MAFSQVGNDTKRPLPRLHCRMSCHSYAISPSAHRKIGKSACPSVRGKNKTHPRPCIFQSATTTTPMAKKRKVRLPAVPTGPDWAWPGVAPLGTRSSTCCTGSKDLRTKDMREQKVSRSALSKCAFLSAEKKVIVEMTTSAYW